MENNQNSTLSYGHFYQNVRGQAQNLGAVGHGLPKF